MNTEIEFKPSHTAVPLLAGSLLFCSVLGYLAKEKTGENTFLFLLIGFLYGSLFVYLQ